MSYALVGTLPVFDGLMATSPERLWQGSVAKWLMER